MAVFFVPRNISIREKQAGNLSERKNFSHNAKWLAGLRITNVKYSWNFQLLSLRLLYERIVLRF